MGREPRILFVAPKIPYPLDGGWNQCMFHTLKNLSARGPVSFASNAPGGDRHSELDFGPVKDLCASVHILKAVPGATLSLVGRADTGHLRALHDGRTINVTGRVPDVAPFVSGAKVSVAPIRVAGGTRIKILESLALGTPLVATTIGAEGLDLVPDRHLKIGDTPRAFAESVIALLNDPERRRAMAAAGRAVVAERYTWEAIGKRLRDDLANWLSQRRSASSRRQ